jgi:uncharacterized protein YciI
MQFIVLGHDGKDAAAPQRRQTARAAHIKGADALKAQGRLLYAVAVLDERENMVGSAMIFDVPSSADIDAWLKTEPYVTGKVWERIEVKPCRVGPSFAR